MRRYYAGEKKRKAFLESAIHDFGRLDSATREFGGFDDRYTKNIIEAIRYGFYRTLVFSLPYLGEIHWAAGIRMKDFYLWKYDNFTLEDEPTDCYVKALTIYARED